VSARWDLDSPWLPPSDIDPECIPLCAAINESMTGVKTVESCCGHGRERYMIWVRVRSLHALAKLCYWLMLCHSGQSGWQVVAQTDCGAQPGIMRIEGPVRGWRPAEEIAKVIREECP
jgi:tRNA(Phe) wybutosine-synthesizing methylase Tyw3